VPRRYLPQPEWVLDRRRRLGERIRRLRLEARLSQDQLVERSGLERRRLQRTERAERDPTYGDLEQIARGLGVPIRDLFGED
jgi:transcriptional regulator with XRE-family HTH domain